MPWSAWCCRPSSNRPAPRLQTAPGCWRWWSFCVCAAARSSTSSWSMAAAGTRCLMEEETLKLDSFQETGRQCVCFCVVLWQTCDVDVLGFVLRGEIKSRSWKFVVHKAKSGGKTHMYQIKGCIQRKYQDIELPHSTQTWVENSFLFSQIKLLSDKMLQNVISAVSISWLGQLFASHKGSVLGLLLFRYLHHVSGSDYTFAWLLLSLLCRWHTTLSVISSSWPLGLCKGLWMPLRHIYVLIQTYVTTHQLSSSKEWRLALPHVRSEQSKLFLSVFPFLEVALDKSNVNVISVLKMSHHASIDLCKLEKPQNTNLYSMASWKSCILSQ